MVKILTRMISEVKTNFKNEQNLNMDCNSCKIQGEISECNQEHLLQCKYLIGGNELLTYIPNYNDIFGNDLDEKIYITMLMMENLRRKVIMEDSMS